MVRQRLDSASTTPVAQTQRVRLTQQVSSSNEGSGSGFDFNRSSVIDGAPDLIHIFIGYGNASVRPISYQVSAAKPSETVGQTVNHDVAAGRHTSLCCLGPIVCVGIGYVHRAIELALCVATVQHIHALGSLVVPLLQLGAKRFASERDSVALQGFSLAHQKKSAIFLNHDDAIGFNGGRHGNLGGEQAAAQAGEKECRYLISHSRIIAIKGLMESAMRNAPGRLNWRMITSRKLSIALMLVCVLPSFGQDVGAKPKTWSVRWQPQRLVNGSPVIFRVSAPERFRSLSGEWLGHSITFAVNDTTNKWDALAGIGLTAAPGRHTLLLRGTTGDGKTVVFESLVPTGRRKYRKVAIRVPKQFTEPSFEQLQVISKDKATKDTVFAEVTPDAEWRGAFRAPVRAKVSDVFGTARTFNGKVQSVHQGLDYAVPSGTPVAALNRGTVLLARPLFFEGNCVVINHGQGLLTLYLHFSDMKVKEGEVVERGQILGLSGGTGRATGPHLHIAVRWQGVYLDPAILLTLHPVETKD